MAVTILKPIDCPVCEEQITGNYCSNCGNQITGRRVKLSTAAGEIINSFFALDRSVTSNFKEMLLRPGRIINLYLDGYRKFYFSPGRYLLIAAAVLALNFSVTKGHFFYMIFNVNDQPSQILFLFFFIPIFTLFSSLSYIGFKRNFFEHLVINAYCFGFWLIWFSIASLISYKIDPEDLPAVPILIFIICVVVYTSSPFKMSLLKRILFILLNLVLVVAGTLGLFLFLEKVVS